LENKRIIKLKSLKSEKKFKEVYHSGRRIYNGNILLIIARIERATNDISKSLNDDEVVEFAVVIGKRTSKSAVIRNRIKRLLRESTRLSLPIIFGDLEHIPFNAIIVTRRKAAGHQKLIKFQEVNSEVIEALVKARKMSK